MNFLENILLLGAGFISFLTYRAGIKDGMRVTSEKEPAPLFTKKTEHIPEENERDFFSQYSNLMSYDFDKAGEKDE